MDEPFTDAAQLRRAPAALSRLTLDGVVVLTPEMSEALHVSVPGGLIWEMVAEPTTLAELVDELSTFYDEPSTTIRAGIEPTLRVLDEVGALVVATASETLQRQGRAPVMLPAATARAIEVDDELIVLDTCDGSLVLLNATGALLWRCLDGVSPLDEIVTDMAEVCGFDATALAHEAEAFVSDLIARGLVDVDTDQHTPGDDP